MVASVGLVAIADSNAIASDLSFTPSTPSSALRLDLAQNPNPNDDRFLQPIPDADDIPPLPDEEETETETEIETEPATPAPDSPATSLEVTRIDVVGSTIFDQEDFEPIIAPLEGRQATVAELQAAADQITQLYLDQGYITSRAILVEQEVTDGVVQIQVVEGSISDIQIEGNERVRNFYIRDRIQLGARTPLRTDRLEDQLRLLRLNPLFENIEASLRAGDQVGESILIVRVEEANPWIVEAGIDNYSPPSVGSERIGIDVGHRNVFGIGDTLIGSWDRTTTGESVVYDLSYRVPLNAKDGTLQLRAQLDENEIPINAALSVEGESELYEISFRQPLVRNPREEFALSLGFSYRDGQTFLGDRPFGFGFGPDPDTGISRTSVFRFGQDYIRRDSQGAWVGRSLFSIGTGLFDATINDDPIPDSRFISWLGQAQRVQRLSDDHLLIVQLDLQLTPDSLLSSEQFVIGGGQSLRGYRQNARAGDNGFRFSVEDRITLARNEAGLATFQLAPFFDMGAVWNDSENPNNVGRPDEEFLAGIGLGLLWEPLPNLNVRLDYGLPLIDTDDRGDNAQDEGFYFSVRYGL
ncbi:MAG: ShlB/FhaC/HecB family hemolysin secretion/activation protein [Thainema sp.]